MRTSSPLGLQKGKIKITKEKRKPKLEESLKTLIFGPVFRYTSEVCPAGVFIGAEGVRVRTQVVHKSRCPGLSELPWKCGICRGIAAFWWQIATRFGAWLLLVRPSGRLLLEAPSWLFIMGFGYNLGIKLSRFQISQYLYPRIL